jgi:phosphoenolpyruvate-protein phosphotransferase/dihydroxyacetone kinase phosphotransfer subunit
LAESAEPLVGIVVVSHSARIAAGVVEVAREMAGDDVRLVAAGGTADGMLGTDAVLIADAIGQADAGAGVLVLADLGSAVLSTKLAFELIDPELAARTRLSGGPLVEGAFMAAIQAAAGDSLAEVLGAAREAATMPKDVDEVVSDGIGATGTPSAASEPAATAGPTKVVEITIKNEHGLHARPAAQFVRAASRFVSRVRVENLTQRSAPVDAKSATAVMRLGVEMGHVIRISVEGTDEDAAIEALQSLAAGGFGEGGKAAADIGGSDAGHPAVPALAAAANRPDSQDAERGRMAGRSTPEIVGNRIAGQPGAAGIAIGPVWIYRDAPTGQAVEAPTQPGISANAAETIRAAAKEAALQLEALAERVRGLGRPDDADIFDAQALIASDPELLDAAVTRADAGELPEAAVEGAAEDASAVLAALPDELLAARAADVRDVGARIVRIITGRDVALPVVPSIAVADDLPPSIAAEIPPGLLLGVALEGGSATAHAVILARGMGIPAIVAAKGLGNAAAGATSVAMDGESGEIVLDPDPAQIADFTARAEALTARRTAAASMRGRPGATADGKHVVLLANIGGPDDAARALEFGAEGVGLFRTEFLFMKRRTAPSEAEQIEPYRRVFEAFGPDRPVVVRLADIGGDKALPYLDLPPEANPFLGVRAIRLAAGNRELLASQLRAIWRAAGKAGVTPHIMAPMVTTLADAQLLIDLRDEARAAVAVSGDPLPERMVTGIMVEVPSAAIIAAELARMVDFFSIGTNDLTQYTMAADRSNPALAYLQDARHPAVLRLIAEIVAGADQAGIPVAVCGELAGDPIGAMILVGLGVDELSADAGSLDSVRAALATVTEAQLTDLGKRALAAPDAEAVRAMARELVRAPMAG